MENKSKSGVGKLYQVSLLQGLLYGDYRGSVTIGELCKNGDIGLGTFDQLNGELILLDGEVYRATGNGNIEIGLASESTPFAVATYMNADLQTDLRGIADMDALQNALQRLVDLRGKNRFYMIRIDGVFDEINVRSVPKQTEPYRPLVEVLEQEQTFFDFATIEGSVVGLYCPAYMSHLNAVGWHMHFISKDRTVGGHLLGIKIADAVLTLCDIDSLEVKLPQNDRFHCFDLAVDQTENIEKVETNK